jgi:catechol 2,3-dioxygenase-like lactoylglutathione lyase family enzyme
MEPRIHVITLAVSDLQRALAFYRDGLGLQTPGVIGTEFVDDETGVSGTVAMFDLHGGLILALYPTWRRTPAFHRQRSRVVSVSVTSFRARPTSTPCSRKPRPPGRR